MTRTFTMIIASALAGLAAISASPAVAQDGAPLAVTVVHTGDLDLLSRSGQRVFEQRLATAAHAVCDTASTVDLKARNSEGECRNRVIAVGRDKARAIASGTGSLPIAIAAQR